MRNIVKGVIVLSIIILSLILIILIQSDKPVIDLPLFLQDVFIKNTPTSNIIENISIGILSSAIFYIFLVFVPEFKKQKWISSEVKSNLEFIVTDCSTFIMQLYKNCCYEFEWEQIDISDDSEIFNENFYERLARFNIWNESDSIFKYKEDDKKVVTYNDLIKAIFERSVSTIDKLLERYLPLMDTKIIKLCSNFRNNVFFSTFLGLENGKHIASLTDSQGNKYVYHIGIYKAYENCDDNLTPILYSDENIKAFGDFINKFLKIRNYVVNKNKALKDVAKRYIIDENAGRTEMGIYFSEAMLLILEDIRDNNFQPRNIKKYKCENRTASQIIRYLHKYGYINASITMKNGKQNIQICGIDNKGLNFLNAGKGR